MKPADLANEAAYPLRRFATLVPIIVSWLLFSVAKFFGLFGLFLFITTAVPFFGYLMRLLNARANNREAPAFDAELMALVTNKWVLFPMVILALLGWSHFVLTKKFSPDIAMVVTVLFSLLVPASLGVLSITQAPLQGLNPFALARFIRATGVDYLQLITTLLIVSVALYFLSESGTSSFLPGLGLIYQVFLLYSMTGAIVAGHRLVDDVHIPAPLTPSVVQSREELIADRQGIVSHAYGFISRGNRDGGLRHIQAHIDKEPDREEASRWFFNEMLKWENSDAALFFAQGYLHRLLQQGNDPVALKLLSQCFHANPEFRPAAEDREQVIELTERYHRSDLLKNLQ